MKNLRRILLGTVALAALWTAPAVAVPQSSGFTVSACGTLLTPYLPGRDGPLTVDLNGNNCISGTISATTSAKATAAAPTYGEGTTNPLSTDLSGQLRITGTISANTTAHATAAAPSYSEGTDNALSQTLAGGLRIAIPVGAVVTGAFGSGAFASGAMSSGTYAIGSISDGADVTLGAKADAKNSATDTTAITAMSVLKEISAMVQAPASTPVTNVGTFATQSAITAAGGSLVDGAITTLGAKADAKSTATDATAITVMQVLKEISAMEQAPATRAVTNVGTFAVQASQATASSLNATVVGLGVAGTPAGGVVSIQGVSGGTVVPISAASLPLPALAATSTLQTSGGQKTQIVDGSGNVIASTSNNLNVECANCSGSGASAADEASFTAGVSVFAPSGGVVLTTPTTTPLSAGQQGLVQLTVNRAMMMNLRTAAGVETGIAAAPLQVSLANTGANATAVLVNQPTAANLNVTAVGTGTFVTQSAITAASGSIASGAVASGAYASGAYASGSISDGADVTLGAKADAKNTATDTTAITVMQVLKEISAMEQAPASRAVTNAGTFATQSAITAASGSIASGAIASGAVASGAYASGSIADGAMVTLGAKADAKNAATDTTAITIMQVLKEISAMAQAPAALPANQSTNVAQINAVTPLMGNGVTGTGSQRVTIASDNTAFSVNGTLQTQTDTVMVGGVNVKEINGVTPLMGNGTTGTGSMRVTIASDNTANSNPFLVTQVPSATAGGTTLFTLTLANTTNATNVKASAGQLYSISGFNMSSATPVWVSLYNNSGTPTCGTSIIQQFLIPGNTTGSGFVYDFANGKAFSSGIAICATTGIAGTGSPAATTYVVNIDYK